jgi:hypothetical protein
MLMIWTSALHFLALIPFISCLPYISKYGNNRLPHFHRVYINLIIISSTFSIIWHYYNEPRNILIYFDYYFATMWFISDMIWAMDLNNISIVLLNIGSFIINIIVNYSNNNILNNIQIGNIIISMTNYQIYHNLWHVINAMKSIYVSYLINTNLIYTEKYNL